VYVEIHTKVDVTSNSAGDYRWASAPRIRIKRIAESGTERPVIEISGGGASFEDVRSTMVEVSRTFSVQLTAKEIGQVLREAVQHGILTLEG
jgi:hypothetical protein